MEQQRLTATEARVAGLVSAGHTNREIAAALQLRSKTVEQHLARICTKLGLESRTELAFLFGTANSPTDSPQIDERGTR
jgi:DNA-binding CsgD family transcriptional regulator